MMMLAMPAAASSGIDIRINSASPGTGSVKLSVSPGAGGASHIVYMIHEGYTLVAEGRVSYSGTLTVSLPVQTNRMRPAEYKLTAWGEDSAGRAGRMYSFDVMMGGGSGYLVTAPVDLNYHGPPPWQNALKAIKTPFANVYSDSTMTNVVVQLQKHNRVFYWPTDNDLIYYVRTYLLPNEVTLTEAEICGASGRQRFKISNAEYFDGFIYANAIMSETLFLPEEIALEAIGLGYSRIGIHGLYSQLDRYSFFRVDCSSFVYWCYKEFGMNFGGAAIADTIVDYLYLQGAINPDAIVFSLLDVGDPGLEVIQAEAFLRTDDFSEADENKAIAVSYSWPTDADFDLLELLKPGDVIGFNYPKNLWYWRILTDDEAQEIIDDGGSVDELADGTFRVRTALNNTRSIEVAQNIHGVDHVGIYVGNGRLIHTTGGFSSDDDEDEISGSHVAVTDLLLPSIVFAGRPSVLVAP